MALPYNLYPWFRGTFQTTQLCTGKQIAPLLRQSLFFDQIKRQRLNNKDSILTQNLAQLWV